MAASQKPPREEVRTTIDYFDDPGVPLVPMIIGGPEKPKRQPKIATPVAIQNVRGREGDFTLDKQGFQYVKHKSKFTTFDDDELVRREHYAELEVMLRQALENTKGLPKPSSIHMMTHIQRYSPVTGEAPKGPAGPLYGVHVDQSFSAAEGVAQRWLGGRAEELLAKPRYMIINIWRPVQTITRDPLAVCDAQSVPDSDLVFVPVQFPDHKTEAVEVKPPTDDAGAHRWYFMDGQTPEDVLLFKQVDSCAAPGVPRRTPHCAFKDTGLKEGEGEPRQSIEIRAFVFFDQVSPDED
ncbi:hypothetical protein PG996_013039 [Apiospora saccharicola]|uniref:Hydroxylase/desaturase asaB n=1 Tax=Apiospora saccharicola TaxID=335842 RepID=A0ABR1U4G4_9PEZI